MGIKTYQNFRTSTHVGSVYTRDVAMWSLWKMHRCKFIPASILNIGVGVSYEMGIWRWMLPKVPILAVDPRDPGRYRQKPKNPERYCQKYGTLRYVQAVVDKQSSSSAVFCQKCGSLQCKRQKAHKAADYWKQIEGYSIDDLVIKYSMKPPHFIWMDIDGSEVLALQGAINTLKDTLWICVELVDWVPGHIRGISKLLHRQGFELKARFNHDGLFFNTRYQKRRARLKKEYRLKRLNVESLYQTD